ncbi:hypothetical protein EDB89DRAFT_2239672, partial [Lactarius sanguifluus]
MLAILRSVAEGGSSTGKPCFVLSDAVSGLEPVPCTRSRDRHHPRVARRASPLRQAPFRRVTRHPLRQLPHRVDDMMNIRSAIAEMAARRCASRSSSLVEQLSCASSSRNGSPSSSSDARKKNLHRALDTAIGSLHTLGSLYERREMRWIEEKHRLDEDQGKVPVKPATRCLTRMYPYPYARVTRTRGPGYRLRRVRATSVRDSGSAREFHIRQFPCSDLRSQNETIGPGQFLIVANKLTFASTMSSSTPGQTATSSDFKSILDAALSEYKKKTGKELLDHPLATEVQRCDSVDAIKAIFQGQAKAFQQFRDDDQRLIKWISPVVDILYTFSGTLGGVAGMAFPPAGVIFTGIGILLAAAKDVKSSHDALVELFERIENFFERLGVYTQISLTAEMAEVFVKIVAEILSILSIATKEVKRKRAKIYFRKLLGRTDIEDALRKLDSLIQEEV